MVRKHLFNQGQKVVKNLKRHHCLSQWMKNPGLFKTMLEKSKDLNVLIKGESSGLQGTKPTSMKPTSMRIVEILLVLLQVLGVNTHARGGTRTHTHTSNFNFQDLRFLTRAVSALVIF
jgi:hypothetical protein